MGVSIDYRLVIIDYLEEEVGIPAFADTGSTGAAARSDCGKDA